jgi:uncharacterized protein (DUF2147 family)
MAVFMRQGLLTAAMALALIGASAHADTGQPFGKWTMGKVTVNVVDCGSELCATIIALKEPISKIDGKPKVDRENPNESKRARPLIGLSIIDGMKPAGDGKWQGTIYNPDDGKTYSASVVYAGDTLKVKGCVAGIFCKTNNFVRVN